MVDGIAAAYHFRVKYNIKKLPLRYKDLIGIADMLGLTVKSYQDAKDEIRERSLNQYRILPAFTALGIDGTLTIFINDQLPEKERNMALTVQIGHQACGSSIMDIVGRSQFEETTIKQNRNAELFALALLAPFCVFKKLKVKSSSEIAAKAYINDEAARSAWEMVQQCNDKSPGAKAAELCAFMLRHEKKAGWYLSLPALYWWECCSFPADFSLIVRTKPKSTPQVLFPKLFMSPQPAENSIQNNAFIPRETM